MFGTYLVACIVLGSGLAIQFVVVAKGKPWSGVQLRPDERAERHHDKLPLPPR
jgi:hypothetical protein